MELPISDSSTVELTAGSMVEQTFTLKIQQLETVSVQWGTYYRPNAGTVTMELWNQAEGELLLSRSFDVAAIPEGGLTTLTTEEPLEGLYEVPLLLRLTADFQPVSAVSPLMNTQAAEENFSLTVNGAETLGVLRLAATGADYIWTGLHYWQFVAAGLGLVLLFLGVVAWRQKRGHSWEGLRKEVPPNTVG